MKFVKDGVTGDTEPALVMVTSESDLEDLDVSIGTIAFTAGYASMWQLGADKQWAEIGAETGD